MLKNIFFQLVIFFSFYQFLNAQEFEKVNTPKYHIAIHTGYAAVGLVPSVGLNLGHHIDQQNLVELDATRGFTFSNDNFANPTTITTGIQFRHFLSRSFNLISGMSYRSFKNNYITGLQVIYYSLDFGIGNRWSKNNFFFACDWHAIHLPVKKIIKYDDSVSESQSVSRESAIFHLNVSIAKLYFGYQF